MKIQIEINEETISDTLCSAFEGGSNYWLRSTRSEVNGDRPSKVYRHDVPLIEGGRVICTLDEAHDKSGQTEYVLDRAALERGIQVMREKHAKHFGDMLAENGDADTGDVFLQCCLFGTVVYG